MNERVVVSSKTTELIYSNRIYCYDDERLNIKVKLTDRKEDELKISFLFKYSNSQGHNIDMRPGADADIEFELTNFNSPFGIGLKKPVPVAKLNDRDIFIVFNVYKNGESNPILDLSLYLENKK